MSKIYFLMTALLIVSESYSQLSEADKYYNRGCPKIRQKDYQGAIADFNKAIELDPMHKLAYSNRAASKYCLQDYRGAIVVYTKTIELDPEDFSVYGERGNAKCQIQDYRGAIADYNKAIELKTPGLGKKSSPGSAGEYYVRRGEAKYNLQDYQGAIADFTRAIELVPIFDDPLFRDISWEKNSPFYRQAFYNRGIVKIINLGQKDSGCMDLSKSGELGHSKAYDAIRKYCN
jgi:tetratricopeptide (TPR) repeat protein